MKSLKKFFNSKASILSNFQIYTRIFDFSLEFFTKPALLLFFNPTFDITPNIRSYLNLTKNSSRRQTEEANLILNHLF